MNFDELDARIRIFETAHDHCVLPGIWMVARIDGRGFTRLTREVHEFDAPFDERFRDLMITTTQHLMNCGFRTAYGYTQSDEISLLFDRDESTFGRKLRKYESILAGEASAAFALALGAHAAFDCRISQLPSEDLVVDYFRWRHEDAHRNALGAHCYWLLRKQGQSATQATKALDRLPSAAKHELLQQNGIDFDAVAGWQKRGVGLFWEDYEKAGINPRTSQTVSTQRRRIRIEYELPVREAYGELIRNFLCAPGGARQ
jgi:tRNA(His) guanylyltransferase